MKKNVWVALVVVMTVALLAAAAVAVFLGPCQGMIDCNGSQTHMKCYWAYRATSLTMLGAAVMSVVAATRKTKDGRAVALVAAVLFAAVAAFMLTPEGIGTCGGEQMACNVHASIIYVLALVGIVVGIVAAVKADPEEAEKPKMSL